MRQYFALPVVIRHDSKKIKKFIELKMKMKSNTVSEIVVPLG